MHQCLSALLLTELFGVLNENSPCFKVVLYLRAVCFIRFGFLFFLFWSLQTCVNSSLVVIGMSIHHTWVTQMGETLGWLPYKGSGVIMPSSVKKDGSLKQHVCTYFVSDNIWFGKACKPPFKVEIIPLICI